MLTLEPVRLQGNYKNIVLSFSTLGLEKVQMWARKSCFSTLDCPDSEDCFWRAALVRVILAPSLTGSPVIVIIIILIIIIIIIIIIIKIIIIISTRYLHLYSLHLDPPGRCRLIKDSLQFKTFSKLNYSTFAELNSRTLCIRQTCSLVSP